jgi:hypothetical protein
MIRKSIFGLALTTLLAFAAGSQLNAQTITFNQPSGVTVHKAVTPSLLDVLPVRATVSDTAGLTDVILSGGIPNVITIANIVGIYPTHPAAAVLTMSFYYDYYPTGAYSFTATAYDLLGHSATQKLTVNVVYP